MTEDDIVEFVTREEEDVPEVEPAQAELIETITLREAYEHLLAVDQFLETSNTTNSQHFSDVSVEIKQFSRPLLLSIITPNMNCLYLKFCLVFRVFTNFYKY